MFFFFFALPQIPLSDRPLILGPRPLQVKPILSAWPLCAKTNRPHGHTILIHVYYSRHKGWRPKAKREADDKQLF